MTSKNQGLTRLAGPRFRQPSPDLLGIYLNDHLVGATGGTELSRRMMRSQADPSRREILGHLADEISQDRHALLAIMAALNVPVLAYKVSAAWLGEKGARLKPNGRLLAPSPLSDLEELEMLRLGVEGKATGWRTLRAKADTDRRLDQGKLDQLIARARNQADLLEDLRVQAAARLIGLERASGSD